MLTNVNLQTYVDLSLTVNIFFVKQVMQIQLYLNGGLDTLYSQHAHWGNKCFDLVIASFFIHNFTNNDLY